MNRFALLDSDNEEEKPKASGSVTTKKTTKTEKTDAPAAKTAAPAAKSAESAPKKANDKPKDNKPKTPKEPRQPKAAPAAAAPAAGGAGGDVELAAPEKAHKRDKASHGRAPRTRHEKKLDETNPHVKPNNRIRGVAHGINRKFRKNSEADEVAKDVEKHPENVEVAADAGEEVEVVPETVEETTPAVPEPTVFTLDEYQSQQEAARANLLAATAKEARKVEDIAGVRKTDVDAGVYNGVAKTKQQKAAKTNAKNVVVDLGFSLDSPAPVVDEARTERRQPQGKRGGPRDAGKGRGGATRSAPKGAKVDISDVNAFPSL